MKKILKKIHLIIALLSVIFLVNISISGSLLVFAKEIQHWLAPTQWTVTPTTAPLPISALLKAVNLGTDDQVKQISVGISPELAWQFKTTKGHYISVDQYRGTVLNQYQREQSFYGFVMAWHRWLLITTEEGKRPLKVVISSVSLLLIIEVLIGGWLWLKPKKRLKRLKIRWSNKLKVNVIQLHGVIGIICAIPLVLMAFSGMAFHWQDQTKAVVETLTLSDIDTVNHPKIIEQDPSQWRIDHAMNAGMIAIKQRQAQLTRIYLPVGAQPLKLRVRMPDEFWGFSWIWLDPTTGRIIDSFDATKTSLATRIWHFKYTFHVGAFFGLTTRLLWLLLALLPGAFAISGLWLYWQRRRSFKV
ncbi:MAG: PepSY domain-containing protein [Gammaproteobacteria bacterium]|nr:PepSY domain-containing protein [Gammaproteobacteria bacterium]